MRKGSEKEEEESCGGGGLEVSGLGAGQYLYNVRLHKADQTVATIGLKVG